MAPKAMHDERGGYMASPVPSMPYGMASHDRAPDSPGIMNRIQQIRGQAEQLIAMADALQNRLEPFSTPGGPEHAVDVNAVGQLKSMSTPSPTSNELDMVSNMLVRVEMQLREISLRLDF